MKTVIIGGGIIGLSCAYYLRREGHEVEVVDRNNITDGCSFGNMGYISPSHFIPIATPGIIAQGLRWMLRSSSPFYIKPRLNADLMRWGLSFYRSANVKQVNENATHLDALLQLSRALLVDMQRDMQHVFSFVESGCWMLYKNQETGDHEKELAEKAGRFGLATVVCNAQQVQEYEKEVEVNVGGGILYKDDGYVLPGELMRALHAHLVQSGVTFYLGEEVKGFEYRNGKIDAVITGSHRLPADEIIIANGSWLPQLSALLHIRLLLQPGKGYSFNYRELDKNLHYPSILVDHRVATTPFDRSLRIGGTMELSGHSDNILPQRVNAIYRGFKQYYPSMDIPAPEPGKTWFGYRPVSPDGLPYIGRHGAFKNLSYAGGHAMLGVSAATGTGKLISEIIAGKKTTIETRAFHPQRFG